MNDILLITQDLHSQIKSDIRKSKTIYILTSFIMRSGIELIYDDLVYALKHEADIKILTGDYLHITQPEALHKLLSLKHPNIDIRMWQSDGISFHPKAYIFNHSDDGAVIVGSSNLSKSALTNGVEWNLRVNRQASEKLFDQSINEYIELFYAPETLQINLETLKTYEESYEKYQETNRILLPDWTKDEEIDLTLPTVYQPEIEFMNPLEPFIDYNLKLMPREAQIEALAALETTVSEEYQRAMVVMATGLGKTYLAAFFAKKYKRILFIAHREEILIQAKKSFEKVLKKPGGLFYGREKNKQTDMLFASIFTLSIQEQLYTFSKEEFDLIIVDEFHHAAAKSYQHVINYFKPDFFLGLTATPERTDGQDVFSLCDGNIAYEITFIEAIQKGWLAPFEYFGIKDDIDYSQIKWLGSKYDQTELTIRQLNKDHAEHIYNSWNKHRQSRTLAFCSTVRQAEYLSAFFNKKGQQTIALTSNSENDLRKRAIHLLTTKQINVIFTVDLFNEGVDIPSVDTLLFARPTESMVVFTQQIGRGLRLHNPNKKCVIIDLIGNYRHADVKLAVFETKKDTQTKQIVPNVPISCSINLDLEVIDLIEEMRHKNSSREERIKYDYYYVKETLGYRPTYTQAHLNGLANSKEYRQVFGGYHAFLLQHNELNNLEKDVASTYTSWLTKLENETMSKSYKMVILKFLLSKGPDNWLEPITPEDAAQYFHDFYMRTEYIKQADFSTTNTKKLWDFNEQKTATLIRNMPMKYLTSKDELIVFENNQLKINFSVENDHKKTLHAMTSEICDYKLHTYFERKTKKTDET